MTVLLDLKNAQLAARAACLVLNNAHAVETSLLDATRLDHLIREAFRASYVDGPAAMLIAFAPAANYDSANFVWFRDRYARFVYVDRVIVAASHRGQGVARRLYDDLFAAARSGAHERVVCEVNSDPPNPASDAFHAALGFQRVGSALLANGKTVTYLERPL